jgi:hypothetical protein
MALSPGIRRMNRAELHRGNVGDRHPATINIHGHFRQLEAAPAKSGFDFETNWLFSMADLVQRLESEEIPIRS